MKITFKHSISAAVFMSHATENMWKYYEVPASLRGHLKLESDQDLGDGRFYHDPTDREMELHAPNSVIRFFRNTIIFEGPRRSLHDSFSDLIPFLKSLEVVKFDSAIPWYEKRDESNHDVPDHVDLLGKDGCVEYVICPSQEDLKYVTAKIKGSTTQRTVKRYRIIIIKSDYT